MHEGRYTWPVLYSKMVLDIKLEDVEIYAPSKADRDLREAVGKVVHFECLVGPISLVLPCLAMYSSLYNMTWRDDRQ